MKTANHQYIRDVNKSIILETLIEFQPISRSEIAKKTGLNKSTVTRIIIDLLEKSLVLEIGNLEKANLGRKAILLTTNANAGHVISLEIDHKTLYGILTNLKGDIIFEYEEAIIDINQGIIVKQIIEFINKFKEALPQSKFGIIGIACGIHGMVSDNQVIEFAPYLRWKHFNLKHILEEHFDVNVYIDNEANYSVIGEHIFYNNFSHMISLNIKTGIGMGVLINRRLYSGSTGYAGEIGHMIIVPQGKPCPCGNKGCFEQYASEEAFLHDLYTRYSSNLNLDKILNHPNIEEIEYLLDYLALGLNNILTIFNLEAIIINSDLFKKIPDFISRLQSRLISNMNTNYQLFLSKLGKRACVLGGTSNVIKNFYDVKYIVLTQK